MKRTVKIALFFLILLSGLTVLAVYWTFYRPMPERQATIELSDLREPVQIKWDAYGVPHIYAENKPDLYQAVGYTHAQDRLWQMTVAQMAAQGRFAEFLGEDLVAIDKLQRTIGIWRTAREMEAQLSDSTRQMLQAYADGVNQYVALHPKALPIQFSLSGMEPITWTPTHSLALARLMAWQLNIAWKTELTYTQLLEKLSADQFKELFPDPAIASTVPSPSDTTGDSSNVSSDSTELSAASTSKIPSNTAAGRTNSLADNTKASAESGSFSAEIQPLLQTQRRYEKLMNIRGIHTGSNAWAVAGSKTTSGKPMLAGDPHLGLSIPGQWYEVHLNLNGRNLSGATLPGAPSVILGQNDALAWSFTNVMLDDTDFFEESLHPQDSSRYLLDSLSAEPVYEEFTVQREVIKVKGGDDHIFSRRLTKHGPVISGVFPSEQRTDGQDKTITMQWTGQQPGRELQALQAMGWANNLSSFRDAVTDFNNPAQNIIYADTAGNIGLFTAARVPIRDGNPITVRPGWQPEMDWQGFIEQDELPALLNPEKGWVANANNPVAEDDFSYYLSIYWQPSSRYQRIEQYLQADDEFSTEAFRAIQNDVFSGYARSATALVLPMLKSSPDSSFSTAINYLENWDYTYGKSETAASVFDVFLLRLTENTLKDEMGDELYRNFISYSAKPARIMLDFLENDSRFFDNTTTEIKETEEDVIRESMSETIRFLRGRFGSNPAEWRWENLHTITLKPPLFSRAADDSTASGTLQLIVDNVLSKGPYPAEGNNMTINNGEYLWTDPYDMVVGPSIRRIVDFSDMKRTHSIIPGGQSGNPLSGYYNDQTPGWLNGQYRSFVQDSALLEEYKTMRLIPAN
jgi:penicillin amidase